MILLYILLGISVLVPIYTYAIYPFVLRLFKPKSRKTLDDYCPKVSVLIIGEDEVKCKEKERNVRKSDYTNIVEILIVKDQAEASNSLKKIHSSVIVMTDEDSTFQKDTISNVINPLSEPCVGCVCGMVRKQPNENGEFCNGANWRYENKIKVLESNIGSLSGANTAIYAFKREYGPDVYDSKINLDFHVPTFISERGFDVLFEPKAVAYEPSESSESALFMKHVADGASGYRSIARFWRLLLPRKGSFVFWSHRVMKWLVPFNMLIILIGCALLATHYIGMFVLFAIQVLFYLYTINYYLLFTSRDKDIKGPIGDLSDIASYFVILNVAWALGFTKLFIPHAK